MEQCKQKKCLQREPNTDCSNKLPPNKEEAQALGYPCKQSQTACTSPVILAPEHCEPAEMLLPASLSLSRVSQEEHILGKSCSVTHREELPSTPGSNPTPGRFLLGIFFSFSSEINKMTT